MYEDPIVEELRAIRREHVKRFNSDPQAILGDLRRQEAESRRTFVQRDIKRLLVPDDVVKAA
jgi:hypothetical protein